MIAARAAGFFALACLLSSCALRPVQRVPPPAAPQAPRPLTAAKRAELDREFYKAVSAYMSGDYAIARERLEEILRLDPADKQALALRQRIQAAEKAGPPAP